MAQEYTCPFAAISNPISAYNQIGQREFVIGETITTYIDTRGMLGIHLFSQKALKLQHPDFNCRIYL